MQPFRIICETCRSRLKIRSPEVIGEIHACPKCGSMVHVVPPTGWRADAAEMSAAHPGPAEQAALAMSTTASLIIPAEVVADLSTAPAGLELYDSNVPPPVSPAAPAGSHLVLWATSGAAAFLVGGLALAIWHARGGNDGTETPAATVAAKAVAISDPPATPPTPAPTIPPMANLKSAAGEPHTVDHSKDAASAKAAAAQPASNPAAVVSAPSKVEASIQPAPLQLPAEKKTDNTNGATTPNVADVAKSTPSNSSAQPAKVVDPTAKEPEHSSVLKFDPLDFDPNRLGLSAKTSAGSKTSTTSIPDQVPGESPAGRVADKGNPSTGEVPRDDKAAAAGAVVPVPAAHPSITVRRGSPADVSPPHAGQQLAGRVKAFQVTDVPIARFIETLCEFANIGITLDPLAIELVGISPRTVVTVNAQEATLEKILGDALKEKRLDLVQQGDQVRVALPKPDEHRTVDYDVKDLVTGSDAAGIAKLIERFVEPATWQPGGGAGTIQVNGTTLHIDHSDKVRRQMVIFCERLRLARKLALRSKYPAELLTVEPPYEKLAAKLGEHTTFTFLAWTRLADVVHQWQEISGPTILVDWGALAEAELGPSAPVACAAIDRTWEESLDGVLEPLGLGWWAVDGQTIQITSLNALEKIQRIEFYSVPAKLRGQFATGPALIDSLQKQIGERTGKDGSQVRMELDEPSGRLIVLGSPAVHRDLSRHLSAAKQIKP